jgi:hypothetical protein
MASTEAREAKRPARPFIFAKQALVMTFWMFNERGRACKGQIIEL